MSQYKAGTVNVTSGNAAVVGVGTAFLANVTVGGVFTKTDSGVPYVVGFVTDDTNLTLASNYGGATENGISYSITNSFTPALGLPYPDQGDIDTATILKRLALLIELYISITLGASLSSKSAAYTTVLDDAGKTLLHPSADTTARTFTIDSNANVPYPVGTAIGFINQNAAGTLTIAITSDTMRKAGDGSTGSRTLPANGLAVAIKLTATEWIIHGAGLL